MAADNSANTGAGGCRLSVIVPVYNMAADDRLRHCMDSLTAQTLPPGTWELIAVDDCSTDTSLQILRSYEAQYPELVRVIASDRNRRQGGAKNLGLAQARGAWIGFIDADDWVTPDYYERLLAAAEAMGADMAGCDYSLVDHYTFEPGQVVPNGKPEQSGVLDDVKYRSLLLDSGSLVVKIYRRHIIYGTEESSGNVFPEDIFYEDNAVCNTWMLRATCYAYVPEPLYFYYQHESSTVHAVSRRHLEDRVESGRLMLSEAQRGGYLERFRPELEFIFTSLFYVNTLFTAMPWRNRFPGVFRFVGALAREQREHFPAFADNPYYQARIHPEERRLIAMQQRSNLLFYLYYRALWCYRGLRRACG
ncbi:MAG: glycosyltransferase [Butyrivibrio sp.]|nr:glycosyltransferase [Butyrivibrio sp.]